MRLRETDGVQRCPSTPSVPTSASNSTTRTWAAIGVDQRSRAGAGPAQTRLAALGRLSRFPGSDAQHVASYQADQQWRTRIKPLRSRHRSQARLKGQAGFPIRPGSASIVRDEQRRAQRHQNMR
jgi:hypothetical protein